MTTKFNLTKSEISRCDKIDVAGKTYLYTVASRPHAKGMMVTLVDIETRERLFGVESVLVKPGMEVGKVAAEMLRQLDKSGCVTKMADSARSRITTKYNKGLSDRRENAKA